MTTTYDPYDPSYLDEKDVRDEMTRVFDLCHGCQRCLDFCPAFPTLFDLIDQHEEPSAGWLTPAQQDQVVDACFQCTRCAVNCPYTPDVHEWSLDFPRLMIRANAMRTENRQHAARHRRTTRVIGRTDLVGRLATATSSLSNRIVGADPGSATRRLAGALTGVSPVRLLPPYAKERFTTWFRKRPEVRIGHRQGSVTIFPTCVVDYQETGIGKDLVRVYERNGIECATTAAGCCGAPLLHAGDIGRFAQIAEKNTSALAAEVRSGTDVVVPQPTCGYVLKTAYPDHVPRSSKADADLVAEHTFDAAEYLMLVHEADESVLDTDFTGPTPQTVTYHAPCHLRAQAIGFKSRDLIKLTGAEVTVVNECSGTDGMWGLRAGNERLSVPIAERLGQHIEQAGGETVAGDCHLANTAILEQTGSRSCHPVQILARAYGIPED